MGAPLGWVAVVLLAGLLLIGLLPAGSSRTVPATVPAAAPAVGQTSPPIAHPAWTSPSAPTPTVSTQSKVSLLATVTSAMAIPGTPVQPAVALSAGLTRIVLHRGDTVWGLGRRYHTTVAALAELNHLANPARILAGATLLVPTVPGRAASVDAVAYSDPAPAPAHPAVEPILTTPTTGSAGTSPASTAQPVRQLAAAVFGPEYACAAGIITRESGWNPSATNPVSGAYGLPQALPPAKMASSGPDWRTNPDTQLRWMRAYVIGRYGGACNAWTFWQAHHWY